MPKKLNRISAAVARLHLHPGIKKKKKQLIREKPGKTLILGRNKIDLTVWDNKTRVKRKKGKIITTKRGKVIKKVQLFDEQGNFIGWER